MSPVPFLLGVHTDIWESHYGENPDVIGCDLDASKLLVPEHIKIPTVPELLRKEVIHRLTLASQLGYSFVSKLNIFFFYLNKNEHPYE